MQFQRQTTQKTPTVYFLGIKEYRFKDSQDFINFFELNKSVISIGDVVEYNLWNRKVPFDVNGRFSRFLQTL